MADRELLLFEITFYESKIAFFRQMISQYEKEIVEVKGELSSIDSVCSSEMLVDAHR